MRWLLGALVALALTAPAYASTLNDEHPISDPPYRPAHQFLPWSTIVPGPAPLTTPAVGSPPIPPPGTCPNGVLDGNDGCAGANVNSGFQLASFFTSVAPQSGQSYVGSGNPNGNAGIVGTPFNLPGIGSGAGYAIGPYTSRANANDPQAAAFSLGTSGSYITPDGVLHVTGTPASTLNFGHVLTGSTVAFGTEVIGSSTYGAGGSTSAATCAGIACTGAGGAGTYLTSNAGQTVGSVGAKVTLTAHSFPANCALTDPTGSFGDYGLLTCGGTWTADYTWENVDFGAVNGHGPTVVFAGIGQTHNFNVYDYWITNSVGSTTGICLTRTVNNGAFFYSETVTSANLNFKWGAIDGGLITGASSCRYVVTQGAMELSSSGSISVEYNAFTNTEGLPVGVHPGSAGGDLSFNLFHNYGFGEWQSHAEIDGVAPVVNTDTPNFTIGYNVILDDAGGPCACATTQIYLTGGVSGFNFNNMTVAKNVSISNTISGTNNFTSGALISYTFSPNSSGTPVGPGPYLKVTSITCGSPCSGSPYVLQGMTITDNNIEIGIDQCTVGCTNTGPNSVPKGGVGSVWTVACSIANVVCPVFGLTNAGSISCTLGASGCNAVSMADFDFKSNNTTAVVSAATAGATSLVFSGAIPGCTAATSPTGQCNTPWTSGTSAKKGQFVFDVTNPSAIPANTIANCVAACSNTIPLSNAVASPGVSAGDIIEFEGLGCPSGIGLCNLTLSDLISVFGTAVQQSHSGMVNLTITGNLFDTTGVGGGALGAIDGSGKCTNPATLAGNLNLIGGGALNTFAVYENSPGC